MKVLLTDISKENGLTIVTAESRIGKLRGIWHYSKAPVMGQSYGIELAFNDNRPIDGSKVEVTKNGCEDISTDGKANVFTAVTEDIDDIYYLRFSPDGLSMLDIKDPPAICIGDYIKFTVECKGTGIYPYSEI